MIDGSPPDFLSTAAFWFLVKFKVPPLGFFFAFMSLTFTDDLPDAFLAGGIVFRSLVRPYHFWLALTFLVKLIVPPLGFFFAFMSLTLTAGLRADFFGAGIFFPFCLAGAFPWPAMHPPLV